MQIDTMTVINFNVYNEGNKPTFVRGSSGTHIDFTFAITARSCHVLTTGEYLMRNPYVYTSISFWRLRKIPNAEHSKCARDGKLKNWT